MPFLPFFSYIFSKEKIFSYYEKNGKNCIFQIFQKFRFSIFKIIFFVETFLVGQHFGLLSRCKILQRFRFSHFQGDLTTPKLAIPDRVRKIGHILQGTFIHLPGKRGMLVPGCLDQQNHNNSANNQVQERKKGQLTSI